MSRSKEVQPRNRKEVSGSEITGFHEYDPLDLPYDVREIDADIFLRMQLNHRLLTADEERELGETLQRGRQAADLFERGKISQDDHAELIRLMNQAVEVFVRHNQRMVYEIANRYHGRGLGILDLCQEGNIGLLRAIDKFDISKGSRFYNYARLWIQQAVFRAIAKKGRTIRHPEDVGDEIYHLLGAENDLEQQLGRSPTQEEIAQALNLSITRVNELSILVQEVMSLESPNDSREMQEIDSQLHDTIDSGESTEDTGDAILLREAIQRILEIWRKDDKKIVIATVIEMHYLDGLSIPEISQFLAISIDKTKQYAAFGINLLKSQHSSDLNGF